MRTNSRKRSNALGLGIHSRSMRAIHTILNSTSANEQEGENVFRVNSAAVCFASIAAAAARGTKRAAVTAEEDEVEYQEETPLCQAGNIRKVLYCIVVQYTMSILRVHFK